MPYEINDRKKGEWHEAWDIPQLFNTVLKIARESGYTWKYRVPKVGEYVVTSDGLELTDASTPACYTSYSPPLTLTPPKPKSKMQEWRERRPLIPDPINFSNMVTYRKALDKWRDLDNQWLSEMPEE